MDQLILLETDRDWKVESLTSGTTIVQAGSKFDSIDIRFWDVNNPQKSTPAMDILIYEVNADIPISEAFFSLSSDLDSVCLTQTQIIRICEKHWLWFPPKSFSNFFLFKENEEYLVGEINYLGLQIKVDCLVPVKIGLLDFNGKRIEPKSRIIIPANY